MSNPMAQTGYADSNRGSNDNLSGQSDYGNHPSIVHKNRAQIEVAHRAKFAYIWCDHCNSDLQRKYLMIQENAIESNYPTSCALPFGCFGECALPPNACCPGCDNVHHTFFDRGLFDRQNCYYRLGCISGDPLMFANEIRHVCCFTDCPVCYNQCQSCYWPWCCGERVRFLPATTVCCCCPTTACWIHNWCGICGIKDGEPLPCYINPVASHLADMEAGRFVESYTRTRADWAQRVGPNIASYGMN